MGHRYSNQRPYSGRFFWEDPRYIYRFPPVNGRYAPVAGGRWNIRRWKDAESRKTGRAWHAWSKGTAKNFSTSFYTWEQAMWWANQVSLAFKNGDEERKAQLMAIKRSLPMDRAA